MNRKIFIGTSGWVYKSWDNKFYPSPLKENKLSYYSKFFKTVEINFSFYRLPTKKNFQAWHDITPDNFKFSVKLSSYITHTKKLKTDLQGEKAILNFINNAFKLKSKLSVILVQLPTNFNCNEVRLKEFIIFVSNALKKRKLRTKLAFEFRNETWFSQIVYKILKEYNCALVINDSAHFPASKQLTANFAYLRFHGPGSLYASKYSQSDLEKWKNEIQNYPKNIKDVFAFFNNDFHAYAIENAKYLSKILNLN